MSELDFDFQRPYVDAEDWDDFLGNVWPKEKERLYEWKKPGLIDSQKIPYPWSEGHYKVNLPKGTSDKDKENHFKKILLDETQTVLGDLKNLSDWDNYKYNIKCKKDILFRGVPYSFAAMIGLGGIEVGIWAPLLGGLIVLGTERLMYSNEKNRKKDLIEGLEKLIDEENVTFNYVEENLTIKTPILL